MAGDHCHALLNYPQEWNSWEIDSREDSPAAEEHWFTVQGLSIPSFALQC